MTSSAARCPMCGNPGIFRFKQMDLLFGIRPDLQHPVLECKSCEVFFQDPVHVKHLGEFYPPAYYASEPGGALHRFLSSLRVRLRARSVEWRARRRAALDIGCGRGSLLKELQGRGWRSVGMDWSVENARRVAESLSIEVVGGDGALKSLASESFDLISMLHVLEHEQMPVALLREAHRLLVPGGRLVVGVPNSRSLTRWLFGRHWVGFDLPRHLWAFTPRSLSRCLELAGFEIESLRGRMTDEWLDLKGSSTLRLRAGGRAHPLAAAGLTLLLLPVTSACSLVGFGSAMYAYAVKR